MRYKVQIVSTISGIAVHVEEKFFEEETEAKSFTRSFNRENLTYDLRRYFFAHYMGEVK